MSFPRKMFERAALRRASLAATLLGVAVVALAGPQRALAQEPVWTETFDDGVGRFNETRGLGDVKFVWNGDSRQIDGEFERTDGDRIDRRYADIGRTLTHEDAFAFSAVVTPTGITPELHSGACLGFWNSDQENMTTWVGVRIGRPWGIRIQGVDDNGGPIETDVFIDFTFGETYFIVFEAAGNGDLTMNVYLGRNASGPHLGSTQLTLRPHPLTLSALGMGNLGRGSTSFWASVDHFSLILPGEPSCELIDGFKVHTKDNRGRCKIRASVISEMPEGTELNICFENDEDCGCKTVVINDRGRGKAMCVTPIEGDHRVCIQECPDICREKPCHPAP